MLIMSIILVLLSNASTSRKDLSLTFNRSVISIFIVSLLIALNSTNYVVLKESIYLFSGLFYNNNLTITFHIFLLFVSLIIVQLTAFSPRNYISNDSSNKEFIKNLLYNLQLSDKNKEQFGIIEYPLIILFIVIAAIFLISSCDIISLFLSIELQSYGLYLLCSLYRNSESSTGAGLTYFLLGGLSSCLILLALSMLYVNSGTSSLSNYYIIANLSNVNDSLSIADLYNNNYLNYSLIILSIGFLFKISAAPFHFWSPDVYDAIPTIVTTFVANIAKISLLVFLLSVVYHTSHLTIFNFNWTNSLLLSSLLSLIIGTVLGLNQSRIKRLLAYSTISHLGFMLLAISINSIESRQAFIFYLMQYSISNINAFMIIIAIGYTIYAHKNKEKVQILSEENNSPIQYIAQLRGYFYINPVLAISLTIVMYSFVGVPPLIGFFAKQMVLSSALDKGYVFITLIAILTSVISAVYYLNIIKEIFFERPNNSSQFNKYYTTTLSINLSITISVFTLIILLFMVNPQEWLSIANILAIYINI